MRIFFVGSHTAGKSTLAQWVSRRWHLGYLTEVARTELAKLETDFDSLRLDIDLASKYQANVFAAQIEAEAAFEARGESFVADRGFDNAAYMAKNAVGVSQLLSSEEYKSYIQRLRLDCQEGLAFVFFVRPLPMNSRNNDGLRASMDLNVADIHSVDGMIQLLLEMGDGEGPVPYIPITSTEPKMRQQTIRMALAATFGIGFDKDAADKAAARFWKYVKKGSSCWEWQGGRHNNYGFFSFDLQTVGAHRFSWMLHNGPIAPDLFVCHSCDNPPCVNPAHLFLGTLADNFRDMFEKGRNAKGDKTVYRMYPELKMRGDKSPSRLHPERLPRGEKHGMARVTADQVRVIRKRCEAGEKQRDVAADYGITQTAVYYIVHRKNWAHVE